MDLTPEQLDELEKLTEAPTFAALDPHRVATLIAMARRTLEAEALVNALRKTCLHYMGHWMPRDLDAREVNEARAQLAAKDALLSECREVITLYVHTYTHGRVRSLLAKLPAVAKEIA